MDDFNLTTIIESKNEWSARLVNILTPCIIEGIKSIFEESYKMCLENEEEEKYLMTFQNLLNNIPKWSSQIVDVEKDRILTSSCCNYLEDLLTCVHISQLKSLTSSRVGLKQKKIDIDIPNLNSFIHKTYINVARKIYINVYLFEKDIMPLQIQKNNRELEIIVKECILNTIRDNIPIENILKNYLDESIETDVQVEETREVIADEEMIKKQEKEKKEKELEKAKQEVKDKIKKENKKNLKQSIINANKDLNTKNLENENPNKVELKTDDSSLNKNDNSQIDYETDKTDNDTDNESDNESDNETDNGKINLGEIINNKDDTLNIKSLNNDPDEIDLEVLDINNDDSNIDLEIMELK
tara:strand:+ start:3967 stop:5034 length:1068 start_codon:yes stop_codon:yes gene_type:complete